jgi:hypothetical protein
MATLLVPNATASTLINAATTQAAALAYFGMASSGSVTFTPTLNGSFSTLTFNIDVSDTLNWFTVATWDASASASKTVYLSSGAPYRIICTGFVGGTDVTVSAQALSNVSSSAVDSDTMHSGTTNVTPKFKVITASGSGVTTIIAAVSAKKLRILKWDLVANAEVNVKWQSHVTPTDITGLYYFGAKGGIHSAFCPIGHFETIAGEALDINLSTGVAVGGVLTYVEI